MSQPQPEVDATGAGGCEDSTTATGELRRPPSRFTEKGVNALKLAEEEARRSKEIQTRSEHILLGLLAEGTGTAAQVLKMNNLNLKDLRTKVAEFFEERPDRNMETPKDSTEGPHAASSQRDALAPLFADQIPIALPLSEQALGIINRTQAEAVLLQHKYLGTEHLLLAILGTKQVNTAPLLEFCGIYNLEKAQIRRQILLLLGKNPT